jgi:glycerol-3-phosphate O-acyltransferase
MAICFELVVNFGQNLEAAHSAALTGPGPYTLPAGKHQIPLHRPLLNRAGPYIEVSILPVSVGWGRGPGRHAAEDQALGS